MTIGLVEKLKNSDFILESKMAELNQNKNSKELDQLEAVWKPETLLSASVYTSSSESLFLKYKKISRKGVMLSVFFKCS